MVYCKEMSEPTSNGNGFKPIKKLKRKPNGRPSKWGKIDPIKVAALAGKLGATDAELAAALDITPMSLGNWKRQNEKLFCTLKEAKAQADSKVVKSLYERAQGYSHKQVEFMIVKGKLRKIETIKHYPPDTTACIYWLKNRRPDDWADRSQHSLSNPDGTPIAGTTVIAPTVVFVQPKEDPLEAAIDITPSQPQVGNGTNGNGESQH